MNTNRQYQVIGLNSEEFDKALDIVNPINQDVLQVQNIFVLKLSKSEAKRMGEVLPTKARIEQLAKQDYLQ